MIFSVSGVFGRSSRTLPVIIPFSIHVDGIRMLHGCCRAEFKGMSAVAEPAAITDDFEMPINQHR